MRQVQRLLVSTTATAKQKAMAMAVPRITQVRPGANVSIVLKADQRTGRQVTGTVSDVLTSGNHPRGIKVRLSDGRVGRVQKMTSFASSATSASVGDDGAQQTGVSASSSHLTKSGRSRTQHKYQDVRFDGHDERPAEALDLTAYIKPAKQSKKNKRGTKIEQQQLEQETQANGRDHDAEQAVATCPICGQFEGDETAVRHHVESHFA